MKSSNIKVSRLTKDGDPERIPSVREAGETALREARIEVERIYKELSQPGKQTDVNERKLIAADCHG